MSPADGARRKVRRFRPFRRVRKLIRRLTQRGEPETPRADRGYLVCSTPRSGSTYLCELLASTGLLGVPREYFNLETRWGHVNRRPPGDLRVLIDRVRTDGATPNGIYGVKAHADQVAIMATTSDPLRLLPNLRLIGIHRRNLLAQAISWARAAHTRQFLADDPPRRPPVYDPAAIRRHLSLLVDQRAAWQAMLAEIDAAPILIEYEQLMQDPQHDVDRVARFLGVHNPTPIEPARIAVRIQRDEFNEECRQRFLAETGDEFHHLA